MPKLSVTIITLNEAAHIGAAIDSVTWADEILVVDCGSTDATVDTARARGATVLHRDWSGWIDQKNFAAERASHDWIFSLDADERIRRLWRVKYGSSCRATPLCAVTACRVSPFTWAMDPDDRFLSDYQTRLYDRRAGRWRGKYVHESVTVRRTRSDAFGMTWSTIRFVTCVDHLDRVNTTRRSPPNRCTKRDGALACSTSSSIRRPRSFATMC